MRRFSHRVSVVGGRDAVLQIFVRLIPAKVRNEMHNLKSHQRPGPRRGAGLNVV